MGSVNLHSSRLQQQPQMMSGPQAESRSALLDLCPAIPAGATITGSTITVEGCGSESLQGDVRFAEVMGLMGAQVQWQPRSITLTGGQ